ncbi:MAG TPA: PadR family transcriptional regulator [Rhodoglobus sp.]|nr:PadR family transcriptional regulator [Rhodoglobus sp.]
MSTAQTDLAVLAALSVEPMTGYRLREAILRDLGAFWSESFGQIYPAITRLREQGFVATEHGERTGSSVHRLTEAGRTRLVELLREPATSPPPRNGLLLRLFFGDALGPEACRALVADARGRAEALLTELAAVRRDADAERAPELPYRLITISAGEHAARAWIAWADETDAVLAALTPATSPVR